MSNHLIFSLTKCLTLSKFYIPLPFLCVSNKIASLHIIFPLFSQSLVFPWILFTSLILPNLNSHKISSLCSIFPSLPIFIFLLLAKILSIPAHTANFLLIFYFTIFSSYALVPHPLLWITSFLPFPDDFSPTQFTPYILFAPKYCLSPPSTVQVCLSSTEQLDHLLNC